MMASVRDFMHPGLIICPPDTRLGEVASLLVRHRVHAIVVAGDDGEQLGVLSDTDLLAGEWLGTSPQDLETMRSITAGELMTSPLATIDAGASVSEAAARLRKERIGRLVVIEDGRPRESSRRPTS
ncbi:MAG: CBS domain-containing protein [Gaiellaceae bacterium]